MNKTVCIVGLGDIGSALAQRLRAFGVRLLCVRKRAELGAPEDCGIERVYAQAQMQEALAQADFVVLAIPETEESRNIINKASLAAMKDGAFLINVGRGGLIDREALLEALQSRKLAGAGLDVFWQEPADPEDELYRENVLVTPHLGGNTDESLQGVLRAIVTNIKLHQDGKEPKHLVNKPLYIRGARTQECRST